MAFGSFTGGGGSRFSGPRTNKDGANNTFRYPSAWWDVAQMNLPTTVKHLFRWCRYHMLVNPLVSAVTKKMASYPITDIIIEEEPPEGFRKNKDRWEDLLFRVLSIGRFQLEAGLDYYGYGNCVVSIMFPFHKYLQCKCGYQERIKRLEYKKAWQFKNFQYVLMCPKCGHNGAAKVKDEYYRSYRDIKLIRWNPQDLEIDFNPITQQKEFAYNVPAKVRKKVLSKKLRYLEELPDHFMRAMKVRRPVVLHKDNVFHFKAPTPSLSANDEGWGYPLILPALKDSFYLQVMKKAQEAVMLEHLVPLDIIYPASVDQTANPYLTVNLSDWKRRIEAEIVKWKWDPNYKPILPLPVGHQRIGGDGRALMLTNEIRAWSEHIIAGMGVPQEFVFGGLSWSGSSVSLRMLENQFMTYRDLHEHFLRDFLIPNVARFMNWESISVHMRSFKMADDVQTKQLLLSLNQMNKVSDKTLLSEFDKDSLQELKIIEQEMRRNLEVQKLDTLYKTAIQGEAQEVSTSFQIRAQERMREAQERMQQDQMGSAGAPPPPGQPPPQGVEDVAGVPHVNVIDLADAWAKKLGGMAPQEQDVVLSKMHTQNPHLHDLIRQKLTVKRALEQEPLPEQRPPRRSDAVI
jgi:hypothetical protein